MDTGEFETRVESLYRLPLDDFVAVRDALAKALRGEGDRARADQVKGLAKPSVTAWAVNQVWWHERPAFQRMLDAGAHLLAVQQASLTGQASNNLREAVEARHHAVNEVVEHAVRAMGGPDRVSPVMRQRIAGTCDALATGDVPSGVTLGRLAADLQPAGFGAFAALMPAAGAIATGPPGRAKPPAPDARPIPRIGPIGTARDGTGRAPEPVAGGARTRRDRQEPAEQSNVRELAAARARTEARARAREALDTARRALDDATQHAKDRRDAADAAARDHVAAQARVVALERELDQARREETTARAGAREASRAASAAEDARERAARDVERARATLERL